MFAIFGHVVSMTYDLWTCNCQKYWTLFQQVFFTHGISYLAHLDGAMTPKLHFNHIWSWCDLEIWPDSIKFSEMLHIPPVNILILRQLCTMHTDGLVGLRYIFPTCSPTVTTLTFDREILKSNHFISMSFLFILEKLVKMWLFFQRYQDNMDAWANARTDGYTNGLTGEQRDNQKKKTYWPLPRPGMKHHYHICQEKKF